MSAYRDKRDGKWRYRRRVTMPDGRRERVTGTPATDTKAAAEHAERMHVVRVTNPGMAQHLAPRAVESDHPTISEFSETFLDNYKPNQKPSALLSKRHILRGTINPFFGHHRVGEVKQMDVDAFASAQLKTVSAKTVNNRLAVLSSLVKYAATQHKFEERKLRFQIRAPTSEVHALPMDQVALLLDAITDERYRRAVLLAAYAGLRVGEIRALQWGDVEDGQIVVRRSADNRGNVGAPKHDRKRKVPILGALAEALAAGKRTGLWVVPTLTGEMLRYCAMREALHAAYVRAKVTPPTMPWHSLRHTFGTQLAAQGVAMPVIKELMGHAEISTTMRYVTVVDAQKRDAIETAFGWATVARKVDKGSDQK